MRPLLLVHGTWGRAQPWHLPGSPLRAEAEARGFTIYDFLWSGLLAGVPTELPGDPLEAANGADHGMLLPWLDAGEKLHLSLPHVNLLEDPGLVAVTHSHGLQVLAFACVRGALFKTVLSVSGPVRRDMLRARRAAQARIGSWVRFADPTGTDRTILDGELFDGQFERAPFALPEGITVSTPGSGHSGLVNDVALREQFKFWDFAT